MNIPRSWFCAAVLGLGAAASLPWIAHRLRAQPLGRCALDGAVVGQATRVRILEGNGRETEFCSLLCAEEWLHVSGIQPAAILVTDETTGEELDAGLAQYVRSQVITQAATRERRHVFRAWQDAKSHADSHHGRILEGDARPFAQW